MFGSLFKRKVHPASGQQSLDWSKIPGSQRKFRTETALKQRGVPVNPGLPVFVDEKAEPRSATEARNRMLSLVVIAARAEGLEREHAIEVLEEFGVRSMLTPKEEAFLELESASEQVRAPFCFQYECVWALQWAMELVPDLGDHTRLCDAAIVAGTARGAASRSAFALRNKETLWDMGDMLYRLHWACTDARVNSRPMPVGLEPGVVWERRRAIQWLIEPDVEWDNISLDT